MLLPRPAGDAPQQPLDQDPSALCSYRMRPIIMTGALLWILRRHFSLATNIVDETLRDYTWTKDDGDSIESKITIESITKFAGPSSQALQRRPAIYVKRNTYRPQRVSIGDAFHGDNPSQQQSVAPGGGNYAVDSGERFGLFIGGSHTVFCVAGVEAEAEALGTEVFFEFLEFASLIRRDLNLYRFYPTEMGAAQRLEESDEHWAVPIVVVYAFEHDWILRSEEPYLKTIELDVTEI